MIEKGKIEVNYNISPKIFLLLFIFSLIMFLIFATMWINIINKVKNYDKVNATIVDVGYHIDYETVKPQYYNYIKFNYTYNGNEYTSEQKAAFRLNKQEGKNVVVYVNPNNPNEMVNTYLKNIYFIISIFLLIMTIFLIKLYTIRKNM